MCGIVGILGTPHAAKEAYQGLLLMQHRGQDAAGILSLDSRGQHYHLHKDAGLVDRVFDREALLGLHGDIAIAHTRYSTVPGQTVTDIQPVMLNYPHGIGLAHNGHLHNMEALKNHLKNDRNRYLFTDNDGEALLNLIADALADSDDPDAFMVSDIARAVRSVFKHAEGGYAVIGTVAKHGFFAFRDPHGIRPLVFGKRDLTDDEREQTDFDAAWCFASESNTMNYLGYERIRDVQPGEFVFIDLEGNVHSDRLTHKPAKPCMFEYVYFANPDSVMDDENVYATRLRMGERLGRQVKTLMDEGVIDPDVVVPVPETSRISAIPLSEVTGVPYRELLIKNRYVQRSFILESQDRRENAVRLKLTPVADELRGKNVLLVDDSIVRGTTSRRIIEMVRNAGANQVYIASASPPILHPCRYGIAFPKHEELLAHGKTLHEIEAELGTDRIIYLTQDNLERAIGKRSLCSACLDGHYPTNTVSDASQATRAGAAGD